jgi:hypothetical protein
MGWMTWIETMNGIFKPSRNESARNHVPSLPQNPETFPRTVRAIFRTFS